MEDDIEFQEWKTDDITLAAWLSLHVEVLETEWHGRQCFWVFDDTDELSDLVSEYVGGMANGNIKEYNSTIARMKRTMFEEERQQGVRSNTIS